MKQMNVKLHGFKENSLERQLLYDPIEKENCKKMNNHSNKKDDKQGLIISLSC